MRTKTRSTVRSLARRWWPIALGLPLGAAAGGGYALAAAPAYSASAYVVVVPQNVADGTVAANFAQAYGRLVTQPQVLRPAAAEIRTPVSRLEGRVRGTTSPDAPMIEVTGTAGTPRGAARAANAVSRSLVRFSDSSSPDTRVRLVAFAGAVAPDRPSSPAPVLDTAVGAATGLLLGGLLMLTRRTDDPAPADGGPGPRPSPQQAAPVAPAEPLMSAGSAGSAGTVRQQYLTADQRPHAANGSRSEA
jgi:capsular polysaccharide biosynthesis protein